MLSPAAVRQVLTQASRITAARSVPTLPQPRVLLLGIDIRPAPRAVLRPAPRAVYRVLCTVCCVPRVLFTLCAVPVC